MHQTTFTDRRHESTQPLCPVCELGFELVEPRQIL